MSPTTGHEIRMRDPRLSEFTDAELRREINVREEQRQREFFDSLGPCPDCGSAIRGFTSDVVETFKSAPKWNAWPLEPPPELVQIDGWRYRIVLTCENGHETEREEVRFRNEAR